MVGEQSINYLLSRVITSVRNGSYRNDDPFNCDRWRAGPTDDGSSVGDDKKKMYLYIYIYIYLLKTITY